MHSEKAEKCHDKSSVSAEAATTCPAINRPIPQHVDMKKPTSRNICASQKPPRRIDNSNHTRGLHQNNCWHGRLQAVAITSNDVYTRGK